MSIEAWVTTPAGAYLGHLDRSEASPFRRFAVSKERSRPGYGALEYHRDNELLRQIPTLLDDDNLVWMRYRGQTRVWIIEDRQTALDATEHASDWVRLGGRGVLQLLGDRLVWPTAFADPPTDPKTWSSQWRSFVNRAAGEMLWDLISESAARFAVPIVRGTVETSGSDGWTQDLRFDTLLDVVDAVAEAFGDADLRGDPASGQLVFDYRTSLGTDRSATVIFEEGADLLRAERDETVRERISWVVGEGVGEGVFAKLAVAKDTTVARRREAYLDAKDAANVALLQLLTDTALAENGKRDAVAFEATEDRFRALVDYDLGDTVRAIAPSRGIDAMATIEAIYLAEQDDDRVRVAVDLGEPRRDHVIALNEQQRSTARSLGVRNRQPQGQLVPFSFSGADVFDDTDTMDVFLYVPSRMYVLIEARAMLRFREFFAPAKSSTSSVGLTSDSGGGATSGASSSTTTDTVAEAHSHPMFSFVDSTPPALTKREYTTATFAGGTGTMTVAIESGATNDMHTGTQSSSGHSHSIAHTHSTPNHQHTVPGHTHGLTYGVFKEAYPASHSVTLKVYELIGSTWTLRATIAGITADVSDQDLTQYITGPGKWRLELKSDAAQPNAGRLGCDVSGYVLGAIQSS